jgi:hypothetical protein
VNQQFEGAALVSVQTAEQRVALSLRVNFEVEPARFSARELDRGHLTSGQEEFSSIWQYLVIRCGTLTDRTS